MTLRKRLIALSMAAACAATAFAGAAFTDQSSIKVDSKVIDTLTEKNVIKGFETVRSSRTSSLPVPRWPR